MATFRTSQCQDDTRSYIVMNKDVRAFLIDGFENLTHERAHQEGLSLGRLFHSIAWLNYGMSCPMRSGQSKAWLPSRRGLKSADIIFVNSN